MSDEGEKGVKEKEFDPTEALNRIGGDEELLREMIDLFISCSGEDLSELEKAMESRELESIRRNAHRIKGSIGNFGTNEAYKAAYALEMCAKNGGEGADELYSDLRRELYHLTGALMRYLSA